MQMMWLTLTIAATVGYHLVMKLTPAGANPFLSLMVTYTLAILLFGGVLAFEETTIGWRAELRRLDWTALALAVAVIALDLGFILLYRSGFEVSLGAFVTQTAAAIVLVAVGVLVFRDRLTTANASGVVLCLAGLWLLNRR